MRVLDRLKKLFFTSSLTDPEKAYDLWASAYDNQPGNLVLDMDEQIFASFLKPGSITTKLIVDVGCGTGRHWALLQSMRPERLIGYDISMGMLDKLKAKFPTAEVYQSTDHRLSEIANNSCDLLVSTLALAHMPHYKLVLKEWARVLKADGELILTDFHPEALEKGGERTFNHEGQLISVRNYTHSLKEIRSVLRQLELQEIRFTERKIDDSVRSYYLKHNALPIFERFKGVPMVYGIHLKKLNVPSSGSHSG